MPSDPAPQAPVQLPPSHVGLSGLWETHATQAPPPVPHAALSLLPPAHTLPLQQPPLHVSPPAHDDEHVLPLQACPIGQSLLLLHPHVVPMHLWPSGEPGHCELAVHPQAPPTHAVPLGEVEQSTQLPSGPQLVLESKHAPVSVVVTSAGASLAVASSLASAPGPSRVASPPLPLLLLLPPLPPAVTSAAPSPPSVATASPPTSRPQAVKSSTPMTPIRSARSRLIPSLTKDEGSLAAVEPQAVPRQAGASTVSGHGLLGPGVGRTNTPGPA